jgi:hypothetical protein
MMGVIVNQVHSAPKAAMFKTPLHAGKGCEVLLAEFRCDSEAASGQKGGCCILAVVQAGNAEPDGKLQPVGSLQLKALALKTTRVRLCEGLSAARLQPRELDMLGNLPVRQVMGVRGITDEGHTGMACDGQGQWAVRVGDDCAIGCGGTDKLLKRGLQLFGRGKPVEMIGFHVIQDAE